MTIITFPLTESRPAHPHLRRFNVRTDLRQVADLVEQCFSDTLDQDGRRYIQQMRRTSEHTQFLSWASGMASRASFPFTGFVWEQDGRIVGNLSLIPMSARRRKVFLIANVAVHPDQRRRGIARKLTEAALQDCRFRRADEVWLHVREDNFNAQSLYREMGFEERSRRTSWHSRFDRVEPASVSGVQWSPFRKRHWSPFLAWMNRLHPDHLDWYLGLNLKIFRPDLFGRIGRILNGVSVRQWAVTRGEQLLGVVCWQRTYAATDRLWLATPHEIDEDAIKVLLTSVLSDRPGSKTLHLEFPAGLAPGVIEASGFTHNHTLIWMQYGGLHDRNRSSG